MGLKFYLENSKLDTSDKNNIAKNTHSSIREYIEYSIERRGNIHKSIIPYSIKEKEIQAIQLKRTQ